MDNKTFSDIHIAPPFDKIFTHYQNFNAVQISLLDVLLHTNKSMVLSAPTGSGKTVAFELAIVRMLIDFQQLHTINSSPSLSTTVATKAIYVAPIKALCSERFDDWKTRFEVVGVKCLLITGDSELEELARLRDAQVIITTPEKWDSLTRHWRDCRDAISSVRLFLIDEVHLLNEDVRGPVLEAIVSRMHTIACETMDQPLRYVVASATIPNVQDITRWIARVGDIQSDSNCKTNNENVTQFVFSDADRPVPLEKFVVGFNSCLREFKFDMSLNYKLMGILRKYSDCKATLVSLTRDQRSLIFCNSRKSAEMAAAALETNISTHFALSDQQKANLTQLSQSLHDSKLRKLTAHGIAYHHAGMSLSDRNQIEDSFRQGNLMVLLCTNTLAMGVNLPARLVVIKSTEYYHHGKMVEYPESTLLQMIGRAGRPQYDTKGVAVILTHSRNVHKYETLMNGKMPIESHLHKHLAEHLNSEIALGTINNLEIAMNWMRSTYFYVRSMQNPTHYGLEQNMDKDIIENKLERMCLVQIQELRSAGLITRNPQNDLDVQTTSYGKLMAKYYLCFETMKLFRQIRGDETFLKILDLIVRCREFSEFAIRVNEKRLLNALNNTPLRFPRAGRIKTREDKISCLLQAVFGNIPIASPTLAQESVKMIRIGDRIAKCLLEYMRLSERQAHAFHLGRYKALLHTVTIAKCFHAKLWENSEYAAKQLQKIGAVYSAQLVYAGKTTLKSLGATDARTIEAILNKSYPFGDEILQNLQQTFPEYSLQLERDSQCMLRLCVRQENEAFIFRGQNAMMIVGDSENEFLLFIEDLDSLLLEFGYFMKTIRLTNPNVEKIYAHVVHATLVGVDVHETLVLNEPTKELVSTPKTKKGKKRKQPSGLESTTKRNKKQKPNLSLSDICDVTINSAVTSKSGSISNLQSFTFSKPKILKNLITTTAEENEQQYPEKDVEYSSERKPMDNAEEVEEEEAFLFNNLASKSDKNSTLVQTKLTQFFTQRKYTSNKSETIIKRYVEFDRLKHSQIKPNNDRKEALESTPRATTPDLHDISAFLETQKSTDVGTAENNEISTSLNLPATECDISKGTHISSSPEVCKPPPLSYENIQNLNPQKTEHEILNDAQISAFLEAHESPVPYELEQQINKSIIENDAATSKTQTLYTETPKIDNGGVSNGVAEPLNLTTKVDFPHEEIQENQHHRQNSNNFDYLNNVEGSPTISPVSISKQNYELCGLDLSRKAKNNLNMSWCDDSMSVVSTTLTGKSPESIKNTPKSVENYLLCYKVSLAFARLRPEERTIFNFRSIYKQMWHTNAAINHITAKLSKSKISREESKKTLSANNSIQRRKTKYVFNNTMTKNKEYVLNLAKKKVGDKKLKDIASPISTAAKMVYHLQPRSANNPKGQDFTKVVKQSKKPELPANPFRLQILNDANDKPTTVQQINGEVMNLVLDRKCNAVGYTENTHPIECADFEEIERELNETQDLPNMSFEDFCSFVLKKPIK